MDMDALYRLYFRDVFLFLQGLTHSESLAEELTQETFFKALNGLKHFDGRQDIRAWLFTVARNCYYSHCRKAKQTVPLDEAFPPLPRSRTWTNCSSTKTPPLPSTSASTGWKSRTRRCSPSGSSANFPTKRSVRSSAIPPTGPA